MNEPMMFQLELIFRIALASVCGLIIGYERQSRNKEAGIRTHAMVALGAALIMVISKYGFDDVGNYDASRVASQIVSGVSFLGAGIIFVRHRAVSGLTTAAGLWATAGVGMSIGAGLYYIGIPVACFMIGMQFILHRQFVLKKGHSYETLLVILKGNPNLEELHRKLAEKEMELVSTEIEMTEERNYRVKLELRLPAARTLMEAGEVVMEFAEVVYLKC